jgi:hypothetical protein
MGLFSSNVDDPEIAYARALVAHHEAGHAGACDEWGIPYSSIHVSVGRDFWGNVRLSGHVMTSKATVDELEYAAMCLAGSESEALWLMEVQGMRKGKARAVAEGHAGVDIRDAREAVQDIRGGFHEAERKARRLVESRWRRITRIADSLVKRGR